MQKPRYELLHLVNECSPNTEIADLRVLLARLCNVYSASNYWESPLWYLDVIPWGSRIPVFLVGSTLVGNMSTASSAIENCICPCECIILSPTKFWRIQSSASESTSVSFTWTLIQWLSQCNDRRVLTILYITPTSTPAGYIIYKNNSQKSQGGTFWTIYFE